MTDPVTSHLSQSAPNSSPVSTTQYAEIAGVVLLRQDGAALLQHRDDKPGLRHAGLWVMPGGHCDPGESLETCACREFLEETTYQCGEVEWLIDFYREAEGEWKAYHLTFYWGVYDGQQSVQCLEGQDLQFIDRDRAADYPIPPEVMEAWDLAIARMAER